MQLLERQDFKHSLTLSMSLLSNTGHENNYCSCCCYIVIVIVCLFVCLV